MSGAKCGGGGDLQEFSPLWRNSGASGQTNRGACIVLSVVAMTLLCTVSMIPVDQDDGRE
jgi:hypothetical protein